MRAFLNQALILLTVFGLVLTPPTLTGYAELRNADLAWTGGDFSSSAFAYKRAARFLPWQTDLWEKAAMSAFFAGDFEEAILLFDRAYQFDSLSASGWDLYGQAFWWSDDHESAQEIWLAGLNAYPLYARFYANLSSAYAEQGNLAAEKDALERWVASGEETNAATHYRLAILLSVADPDRALGEFLLAASLDPEYDAAVETMRTTLNLALLETDVSRRSIVVGRGLGLINEWAVAEQAFRQAAAADGENAEAWAWLGEAGQHLGRGGRAELDTALKYGRMNPIVRSLRGLYWSRQGKYSQALAEYLLAAEYDPENPVWQYTAGEMYAQLGDLPPALAHFQRATGIAPENADAWRLLAEFCAQNGVQVQEIGLPAAQMAVELTGEDPLALDTLGWTLALLGRFDEARDALEHALSLAPHLAQGHLHLAIVAIQLDEWDVAKAHLQMARNQDQGGAFGQQAQMLLNQYFP